MDDKNALSFNFELTNIKKNTIIQNPGDIPKNMMLILKGVAEIYISLNDHEFTLEYLRPGDIINHNLFLLGKPV